MFCLQNLNQRVKQFKKQQIAIYNDSKFIVKKIFTNDLFFSYILQILIHI